MDILSGGQPPTDKTPPAGSARQPSQVQKIVLLSRSSRRAETIVNVVAVVVAVVVILYTFVALWYWNRAIIFTCDENYCAAIEIALGTSGNNWTMTVSHVQGNMRPSDIYMTIFDSNGTVKMPMSSVPIPTLTLANWTTYKVAFQKMHAGIDVGVGDKIFVDRESYPLGYHYRLHDSTRILATGEFH